VVAHRVDWRPPAIEDMRALFEYLLEHASLWDAENVTEQVLRSTDRLV
jgi:toxin ParE1/3/4